VPTHPVSAVMETLRRDSRLRKSASQTISYLLDQLYYGDFEIFEQVSSTLSHDFLNVVGAKGPKGGAPPLWLVGCVGTGALPSPSRWASTGGDPFEPRRDRARGVVYGLGAASGKADLILKILAASQFRSEELRRPLRLVALFGEEGRITGIRSLLDGDEDEQGRGAALVGAPTNLELWAAHPGLMSFRVAVRRRVRHRRMPPVRGIFELSIAGRSAHAQLPAVGDDAVDKALSALAALRAAGDVRVLRFEGGDTLNTIPGASSMLVATGYDELPPLPSGVEARPLPDGTAVPFPVDDVLGAWLAMRDAAVEAAAPVAQPQHNPRGARPLVPVHVGWLATERDAAVGTLAFWTGPGVRAQDVGERLAAVVHDTVGAAKELYAEVEVVQDRPAFEAPALGDFADAAAAALRSAGTPAAVTAGLSTTDAGTLVGSGARALVFGPGRGIGDRYRDDELVPEEHLMVAYRFYVDMIRRWCT